MDKYLDFIERAEVGKKKIEIPVFLLSFENKKTFYDEIPFRVLLFTNISLTLTVI